MSWREQNRKAWNRIAQGDNQFARVATDEECSRPLQILDGRGWLPRDVTGLDVLCLASGGGWQSILYAVAGANVTVVDISDSMLTLDRREAERRGLSVRTVQASMDDLHELHEETFDVVHQPVSTCYVPELLPVYREIARVCRDGGIYISQHKQPASLQITRRNADDHFIVGLEYYREGPLPNVPDTSYREAGTTEYLHRWEQLVGDLCACGFVIEDLREPLRADVRADVTSYKYRGRFLPPYVRLKARRRPRAEMNAAQEKPSLWTP
jgi:SAM-dependent methyltransferase